MTKWVNFVKMTVVMERNESENETSFEKTWVSDFRFETLMEIVSYQTVNSILIKWQSVKGPPKLDWSEFENNWNSVVSRS